MEALFDGNIVFVFFFAMVAIYNYSDLKEYQRIAIIYITVYSLVVTGIVGIKLAIILLFLTMFCFLEILTKDETKFKIIVNPIYKILDCLYLSFFQYAIFYVIIAIVLCNNSFKNIFYGSEQFYFILSMLVIIIAIARTLQQKFVINSFNEMYRVFAEFQDACNILVSIEDRTYYERKGYTFLSINALRCVLRRKIENNKISEKMKYTYIAGKKFVRNAFSEDRGYSTLPMQLIRSLGIKRGYNYKYRRKIFELDKVANREYIKQYFLYIYFHKVNTFLGDATFSKFLNAFDMQYNAKNKKDIYDCSNEGIFIACMGLSKRALLTMFI